MCRSRRAPHRLIRFVLLKTLTRKKASIKLPVFMRLLDELANTLRSWLKPIVAMWRFRKSNGITEGFHNKMEMMTRRVYGFRNFENYRMRVLAHCGWDGVINRVR